MSNKLRDSNMELLRIVAMLLVMVVHANFRALPKPDAAAIAAWPSSAFLQFMTEGFSIVAVDVFILLSGWYAIRFRPARLAELAFQLLFFGLVCMGAEWALTGAVPPKAVTTVLLLNEGDYWFVKTYVALYLVSPMLNHFAEQAPRRQLETVLVGFFAFQWVFGWVFEATSWLRAGYSLPSFMALYLLARYLHIYQPRLARLSRSADLLVYLAVAAFLTVAVFCLRHYNLGGVLYFYNSPVVILGAVHLLLFFSKLSFRSRLVNWVAASAFSIYLTHSSSFMGKYYDEAVRQWFYHESRPAFILHAALLIAAVFCLSILTDKLRILLWKLTGPGRKLQAKT